MKTKIISYLVLLLILSAGVYIRTHNLSNIMSDNTVDFYYARARDLQANNQYPLEDRLSYAPEVLKEDYPPFSAYFSVGMYRIIEPFFNISFYDFIMLFPVLVYIIMLILGFFIMNNLYGRNTGFFFAALLTIMPAAGFLTRKGNYTEEPLGVLLILLFFFFFIKSEKNKWHAFFAIVTLTTLELTWQIFHLVLGGVIACLIIRRKNVKTYLLILILPLLLGHVISVYLIGLDYSPVYMLKEAYIGYKYEHTEDFQIALHRDKHVPMDIQWYIQEYSYLATVFLVLGLFVCFRNLRRVEFGVLLVFSVLGFVAIGKYVKFRFLSLLFILILCSLGLNWFYDLDLFTKLDLRKRFRRYWRFLLAGLVLLLVLLVLWFVWGPKCDVGLVLPEEEMVVGRVYDVVLDVENVGKGAWCFGQAFSGLHVEVENARVVSRMAYSSVGLAEVVEKNYTSGGLDWFEVKFGCLRRGGVGRVSFSVVPLVLPVRVNYRCWIPRFCLRGVPEGILPDFSVAWRNERCLYREPSEGVFCSVPVYAGYQEKQNYYCKTITLN